MNDQQKERAAEAIAELLRALGEDPTAENLRDTPDRVARAFVEFTSGRFINPDAVLGTTFPAPAERDLVLVRGVTFTSLCEHHLLPFFGTVDIGYVPGERIVGLSKLARLVDCYAKRLQLQEQLTDQIASTLQSVLEPAGVAVVMRGSHTCLGCRGARRTGAEMVTSTLRGVLRDEPFRSQFLSEVSTRLS